MSTTYSEQQATRVKPEQPSAGISTQKLKVQTLVSNKANNHTHSVTLHLLIIGAFIMLDRLSQNLLVVVSFLALLVGISGVLFFALRSRK